MNQNQVPPGFEAQAEMIKKMLKGKLKDSSLNNLLNEAGVDTQ